MKGSRRAAEAYYYERPSEAIGEDAASIAVKTQDLRDLKEEAEALHHVTGRFSKEKPGEAAGKGTALPAAEIPAYWRHWGHETLIKDRVGME